MSGSVLAADAIAEPVPAARFALALAVTIVLALAGCDDAAQSEAKSTRPFRLPPEQCLGTLHDRAVTFEPASPVNDGNGCAIPTPVTLTAMTAALNRPVTLGCSLAVRFDAFERQVLQPLALRYFGQPVKRIHHYGAYACRNQRGGNSERLSQHAVGRAIDIAAFELVDGTMIRVREDWNGIGRRSRFLRNVAREACDLFHMVLTPSHDRNHSDHLHFDTGPWRKCAT